MLKLVWRKATKDEQEQYSFGPTAKMAQVQDVTLHGDDGSMVVSMDIMLEPGIVLVSLYRYDDKNPYNDFQVTYTRDAETLAIGKALASDLEMVLSLRGLHYSGWNRWD